MLVRLDAVFEGALGFVLLGGVATGAFEGSDFSVAAPALVVVGALLLALAVVIWSGRIGLRALAVGNALGAIAGIVWLLVDPGLSTAGTVVTAVAIACLAALAAAQAATLRA